MPKEKRKKKAGKKKASTKKRVVKKRTTKKRLGKKKGSKKPVRKKLTKPVKSVDSLLVELGTEELPPKSLKRLSESFGQLFFDGLVKAGFISDTNKGYELFAAPRRLAVRVVGVIARQPDRKRERRGPALQAAFDSDGKPAKALLGFAKSCGVPVNKLERLETDKGVWMVHRTTEKGLAVDKLVPRILSDAIKKLPIAKRMRWSDLDAEFVRPVHWLVLLHGKNILKAEVLSVKSGRRSEGHRFMGKAVNIPTADKYESALERQGKVIASFSRRRALILDKIRELEKTIGSARHKARIYVDQATSLKSAFPEQKDITISENARFCLGDSALVDEVTSLVEFPEVYVGDFDKEFLEVPIECLSISMKQHQKYFPVFNDQAGLMPKFVVVSNIKPRSAKFVIEGNERVLRARLSDAKFFFDQDRKIKLETRVTDLRDVMYHRKLGSQLDRVNRLKKLAREIAVQLSGGRLSENVDLAERAAQLCKADLLTGMVREFPELQGIMGKYYARQDGESEIVAQAIESHYYPRFAGDNISQGIVAQSLALADKLDTLAGIFWAGEIPTGDKDPYGLRRLALGTLRILIEGKLDLNLMDLLVKAADGFSWKIDLTVPQQVRQFMLERLRAYYQDEGISHDVFESVLACKPDRPFDFDRRVRAVMAFRNLKEAESLTAANKRVSNILKQGGTADWDHVSKELLTDPAEINLFKQVNKFDKELAPVFADGDYTRAMKRLAELRPQVDNFFDEVMVMVDEEAVRDNRLALLDSMRKLFLRIADLSKLRGQA
ncbi:MAG: glycine--tRNA ligase subunit beta [Gammaproteobacteria bacterium]|nr:MAG: glycine--tRNA ligase subunit beta [Gammaproteobacteria bacterium]